MPAKHLAPLTWLRACAAFFIVIHHCFYTAGATYAADDVPAYFTPLNFLDLGTFAVYLFFALSGCALTLGYRHAFNGTAAIPAAVGAFYLLRWMRIWPVFAVSVVIYLLYREVFKVYYTADLSYWVGQLARDFDPISLVNYLTLTFNITGPKGVLIGAYWSLPVEFQYYLLLPIALLLMRKKPWGYCIPIVLGVFLYALYSKKLHAFADASFFNRAYVFFGGVLAAYMYPAVQRRIPWGIALLGFFVLVLILGLVRHQFVFLPQNIFFLSDEGNFDGVCAILMVFLGLFTRVPKTVPRWFNFVEHYGKISYSIYLFHYIFISAAALAIIHWHIYGGYQKFFFVVAVALVGSFVFASFTYRWIEKPCITLGRRWAKSIAPKMVHY